jgi:hypothetical protein
MYQMRQRNHQEVFEQESNYLVRPASAQGRFTSPGSRLSGPMIPPSQVPPPGFDNEDMPELDPNMAQALATLSAAGNLTPQQIQQIQMHFRYSSPVANGNPDMMKMKKTEMVGASPGGGGGGGAAAALISPAPGYQKSQTTGSPTRKDKRDHSPTSGGSSPTRSALLEEFRSIKNKKFELKVLV